MKPQFLRLVFSSILFASAAIALPSRSIAEEVKSVDTAPATQESTLPAEVPSKDAAKTNEEEVSQPVVRGSSSHYRRRYNNANRRPPSVQDENNAKTRSSSWWFN